MRFVIVGGVAVVLHGYVRATVDLDLVVDLESEPAILAIEALERLGLRPSIPVNAAEFASMENRTRWRSEKNMLAFSMIDPNDAFRHVDLLIDSPVSFQELFRDSFQAETFGIPIRVASIEHLIQMKRQAGRPKDLLDVQHLVAMLEDEEPTDDG